MAMENGPSVGDLPIKPPFRENVPAMFDDTRGYIKATKPANPGLSSQIRHVLNAYSGVMLSEMGMAQFCSHVTHGSCQQVIKRPVKCWKILRFTYIRRGGNTRP